MASRGAVYCITVWSGMDYQQYLQSHKWQHKRLLRIKVDGFKCRTCLAEKDLEVHHVTYERLGNERLGDLITLCRDCHYAITNSIRERRHKSKKIRFHLEQERKLNYVAEDYGEVDWSSTVDNAQWRDGKSTQRGNESTQENIFQTIKDGGRLSRNG